MDALATAHVLLIGAGGIGGHAALALAAAGTGRLTVMDFDAVDETNLARQTLYTPADVGTNKAVAAATRLREQNPHCDVQSVPLRADDATLAEVRSDVTCLVDGSDNYATRFAANRLAVRRAIPLVTGSAIRWEGQFATFGPDYVAGPCYACVYEADDESLADCQGAGVLASVPGTIGQFLATEVLALATGRTRPATMTLWDARSGQLTQLDMKKSPHCAVCANSASQRGT